MSKPKKKELKPTYPEDDLDQGYISPIKSLFKAKSEEIIDTVKNSRYAQLVLAFTIIAAILRIYNLGYNSLWLDEASTYTFASQSFEGIWNATANGEFNPPLFHWIEHIMLFLGNNEFILRLVPALAGILTIPFIYIAGKQFFDRNIGLIAAGSATFSEFLIYYSQEARAYSLMFLFLVIALVFYFKALKNDKLSDWLIFSVFSALAFWTHFYSITLIASLFIYAIWFKYQTGLKDIIKKIKNTLISGILFTILTLPLTILAISLFTKRTAIGPTFGLQGFNLIYQTLYQMTGYSWAFIIVGILFLWGIIVAYFNDRPKAWFLIFTTVGTFAISIILSYEIPMVPRYLIFFNIILLFGAALSYKTLMVIWENKLAIYSVLLVLMIISIVPLVSYYSGYTKDNWRGIGSLMSENVKPGDVIVTIPGYISQPFDYYFNSTNHSVQELGANNVSQLENIQFLKTPNNHIYYLITTDVVSIDPNQTIIKWLPEHAKAVGSITGITIGET